ncbi:MAG: methyltransferase domain-containing protein [Hyphomicrobiales bacterium]|nr:methyltransferase domain-containing protein [Hyphomicrobiales bacterium]
MDIFDRRIVRQRRQRAASTLPEHQFLLLDVAERLADRLDDIRRRFPLALDLGCHQGQLAGVLAGRGGIETLVHADLSEDMALRVPVPVVVADEEALPFADGSFDLIMSLLSLHWVNDLPGALVQIRRALRPDGFFVAAMLGGKTLYELRTALADAEIAGEGGISPRISPFADVRDVGNLLQRAGFALPVADVETIKVSYQDPLNLLRDLRGMGETNAALMRRKTFSRRSTLFDSLRRYRDMFATADGRIPATFQIVFMAGWAPDPSQQQPLRPGSAKVNLADALSAPSASTYGSMGGGDGPDC